MTLKDYSQYSQQELINLVQDGDERAFAFLFYSSKKLIFIFLVKITKNKTDAEDLLQEVFISIWNSRNILGSVTNLNAYIFKIAQNKAIDFLRKKNNSQINITNDSDLNTTNISSSEMPSNLIESKELNEKFYSAVKKLPQKQKESFLLYKEFGMGQRDIAKLLNVSISTIKNNVMHAVANLKKNFFKD